MKSILHVRLLGGFSLMWDGAPVVSVNSTRLQALLAYLLLHRDAPQSRTYLAYLFWPDSTEMQAHTNLRNLFYLLRRALPDADEFLQADAQTIQWRADAPYDLDVDGFRDALARAERADQAGNQAEARLALEQAIALYLGDLLPSCYSDWILPEREQLRQALVEALERLVQLLENCGDYSGAIHYAQSLLIHDPLDEATYRCLMHLHALEGDRAGALRVYYACVTLLQRELAVEPGPATCQVYEQLLRMDVQPRPLPNAPKPLFAASPLMAREREWAQLQLAWQAAAVGQPQLVLLSGEAGTGKTRLMEELFQWANHQGVDTAFARCYMAERDLAYAPVAAWLRARPLPPIQDIWLTEVARLLPEILINRPGIPEPQPLAEGWQCQRLFEALARAILGNRQPLLLFIDDVQWCDSETLEWLHFLLHCDPAAPLLVVGTLSLEEAPDNSSLALFLRTLRHNAQLTELELGALTETQTALLATGLAGRELDPALAARLYEETDGNPLFIVESVRAGFASGQRSPVASLPPTVQAVIKDRLEHLSAPARELVGVAATIGRKFEYQVLKRVSGLDEDTLVNALDELWRRRILRENGADAYDFSHDKLRQVAYSTLSAARRRILHLRIAETFNSTIWAEHMLDAVSAQVAFHYEQAGQLEKAIEHYRRAADAAQQVYAVEKAAEYRQKAQQLLEQVQLDSPELMIKLPIKTSQALAI